MQKVKTTISKQIVYKSIIITCDPGKNCGIAIFRGGKLVIAFSVSCYSVGFVRITDIDGMMEALKEGVEEALKLPNQEPGDVPIFSVLEVPFFPPRNSRVSAFTFGCEFGTLIYGLNLVCDKFFFVRPADWKGYFQLGKDKNDSLVKLSKLYGEETIFRIERDHNVAEAILMGLYSYANCQKVFVMGKS